MRTPKEKAGGTISLIWGKYGGFLQTIEEGFKIKAEVEKLIE